MFLLFNSEHPQAEVIGTDVSPIQPNWYVEPTLGDFYRQFKVIARS